MSASKPRTAAAGDDKSGRRKMQELGRKPESDGGIGDKILSVMASESAQQLSGFYLSVMAGDAPVLKKSDTPVSFLEIGHGSGQMLHEACQLNSHADSKFTGIEWSEAMHKLAKTIATDARVNLLMADANSQLPLPDTSYDIVASAHCVYFWDDLSGSVQEQARLLKPGGVLCIIMSKATKAWDRDVYKNVDVDTIKKALEAAGLVVHSSEIAGEESHEGGGGDDAEGGGEGGSAKDDVNEIMQFFSEHAPKELFEAKYDTYIVGRK